MVSAKLKEIKNNLPEISFDEKISPISNYDFQFEKSSNIFIASLYVKIISDITETVGEISYSMTYELGGIPFSYPYLRHACHVLFEECNTYLLQAYNGRVLFYFQLDSELQKIFDRLVSSDL